MKSFCQSPAIEVFTGDIDPVLQYLGSRDIDHGGLSRSCLLTISSLLVLCEQRGISLRQRGARDLYCDKDCLGAKRTHWTMLTMKRNPSPEFFTDVLVFM